MKVAKILLIPSVELLLFMFENTEVRHSELSDLISSRGTLSYSLTELEEEALIRRRVVPSKPVQSFYSLTSKGHKIAKGFEEIKRVMSLGN